MNKITVCSSNQIIPEDKLYLTLGTIIRWSNEAIVNPITAVKLSSNQEIVVFRVFLAQALVIKG